LFRRKKLKFLDNPIREAVYLDVKEMMAVEYDRFDPSSCATSSVSSSQDQEIPKKRGRIDQIDDSSDEELAKIPDDNRTKALNEFEAYMRFKFSDGEFFMPVSLPLY
jgi:hypothetical protein